MTKSQMVVISMLSAAGLCGAAGAQPVFFSTNGTNLLMGAASRPEGNGVEIEAADDFLLGQGTRLTGATVTGLIPHGADPSEVHSVVVEIYRVFPLDSDTTRLARVPTRQNSPGDNAFATRDAGTGLTFEVRALDQSVTVQNSVVNGINPSPDQRTLGEGAVTGDEVEIHVNFTQPIDLPPGHYFFVPQVSIVAGDFGVPGDFLWLSAPKPIVAPGTPFLGDLQAWIRNTRLEPDWLRIGGDIVGGTPAPAFNMVLSLEGTPGPCRADFNSDGDVGTDQDIEDFFACLAGNCCATCGTADFDGDGELATDADIEAFFRVLAGNPC
jgi:hypothetical protein